MPLTAEQAFEAYGRGAFPMGDPQTGEIGWVCPDPRAVLPLDSFHCPRRLERTIRSGRFEITTDRDFEGVVDGCSDRASTWIVPALRKIYSDFFRRGLAHSVEAGRNGKLVGGIYGVHAGAAFLAESMFHRERDAGKVALVALVRHLRKRGFALLDVQQMTPMVRQFGALLVPFRDFHRRLLSSLRRTAEWGVLKPGITPK